MLLLAQAVQTLFTVFFWLIVVRSLLSWIRPSGYNRLLADLNRTLEALTEPILAPIRNVLPGGGMGMDWSPLIALLLLEVAQHLVVGLLVRI